MAEFHPCNPGSVPVVTHRKKDHSQFAFNECSFARQTLKLIKSYKHIGLDQQSNSQTCFEVNIINVYKLRRRAFFAMEIYAKPSRARFRDRHSADRLLSHKNIFAGFVLNLE